jgi:hypothetical protein
MKSTVGDDNEPEDEREGEVYNVKGMYSTALDGSRELIKRREALRCSVTRGREY